MKLLMFVLSLLTSVSVFAAQSYPLFEGAPAAKLYSALQGSPVVSTGPNKVLNFSNDHSMLLCDSQQCSVAFSSFKPSLFTDGDILLQVKGVDADLLAAAIPSFPKNGDLELGYVGQYGSAYLYCTTGEKEKICTFGINYCYQPGC
jgi:hypothetical protein